jgi:trk system potassium uptake protein
MSGFTATGATAIVDFDAVPATLFLYRAFSQWVGGIGILVLFIAVFPQLAIAGRQLFHAEMPGPTEERLTPRLRHTAGIVLGVYLALTVVCMVAYVMAGMPLFDAVAHAFTTSPPPASARAPAQLRGVRSGRRLGGPRVHDARGRELRPPVAGVRRPAARPPARPRTRCLRHDRPRRRRPRQLADLVAVPAVDALRHGFFQVVSIVTTTGYATVDFDAWPDAARALLVLLMFVGGSAGSAAGGVKVARWLIMGQHTAREVRGRSTRARSCRSAWATGS